MGMLKTIGEGHDRRPAELIDAERRAGPHTGSLKNIDDYLVWGPRRERRKQTAHMERYLDDGHGHIGRCLAFGKTDSLHHEGEHGWAQEMDRTREQMEVTHEAGARTYYHFCISPDPADHVGADELRDLALEWIERCLPGTQAVVSVHDDNAGNIMHAHVVVNAVYPDTGRRIHISNEQTHRNARVLQDLCRAHEMTAMPDAHERQQAERRQRWAREGMAERQMAARGQRSWKQDIREAVDEAVGEAQSWGKFCYRLGLKGYRAREDARGEVTYYHPKSSGHNLRARGIKLGDAYTKEGVTARLLIDMDALARGSLRWRRRQGSSKGVGYRAARHAGAVGMATLAERLAAGARRTRAGRSAAEIEGNLRALATVRREGIENGRELALMAETARARAGELANLTDTASTTLSRLSATLDKADEAWRLREEVRKLPAGTWALGTRRKRNALEGRAEELERDVDSVLAAPSVASSLVRLGLTGEFTPRISKLKGLVRLARGQADDVRLANEAELERLDAIISAAEVARQGAHPHDRARSRPQGQGPLSLAPSARRPHGLASSRNEVTEALEAIAAMRWRQQAEETLAEIDARLAHEGVRAPKSAPRPHQARTGQKYGPQDHTSTPSAADVRASAKANRNWVGQTGGGDAVRRQ